MHNAFSPILGGAPGPAVGTGKWTRLGKAFGALLLLVWLLGSGAMPVAAVLPTYSVTIAWDPNPEPTVIGYRAHYGVASRNYPYPADVGNTTSVTIFGLVEGTTYYFAITAYNVLGLESDFSEELTYVPGKPSVRARVSASGQAVLTLCGRINQAYAIEATENFNAWTAIATVTLGAKGTYEFTDSRVSLFPRRFYRLRDLQALTP